MLWLVNETITLTDAVPLNVTVPVDVAPWATVVGLTEIPTSANGFTVSVTLWVVPKVALIEARVWVETAVVVIVKVAVVAPAATETVDGTDALAVLLESATEIPPTGAGLLSVTVPVELFPPMTVVGTREMD